MDEKLNIIQSLFNLITISDNIDELQQYYEKCWIIYIDIYKMFNIYNLTKPIFSIEDLQLLIQIFNLFKIIIQFLSDKKVKLNISIDVFNLPNEKIVFLENGVINTLFYTPLLICIHSLHLDSQNITSSDSILLIFELYKLKMNIIKLLLEYCKNINEDDINKIFNSYEFTSMNEYKLNPISSLSIAIENSQLELVKILVEFGGNINIISEKTLSICVNKEDYEMIKFLLSNGIDQLHFNYLFNKLKSDYLMLKIFLENGFNPNYIFTLTNNKIASFFGKLKQMTLLCYTKDIKIIQLLISYSANVNYHNPLSFILNRIVDSFNSEECENEINIAFLLLENGANIIYNEDIFRKLTFYCNKNKIFLSNKKNFKKINKLLHLICRTNFLNLAEGINRYIPITKNIFYLFSDDNIREICSYMGPNYT